MITFARPLSTEKIIDEPNIIDQLADNYFPSSGDIQFKHLSVDDGLSQVSVSDISQDADGFMWFATEEGVNRYDGKDFLSFLAAPQEAGSLPGNVVTFSRFTRDQSLWIGTNGQGIARKKTKQDSFQNFPFYSKGNPLANVRCKSFLEASNGDIWVGTAGQGLFKFDPLQQTFINVWLRKGVHSHIWSIAEWQQQLYLGTEGAGVWQFDPEVIIQPKPTSSLFSQSKVQYLQADSSQLWIATDSGLWLLNQDKNIVQVKADLQGVKLSEQNIYKLLIDQHSNLWIGTLGQGVIVKSPTGNWIHLKSNQKINSLSNNRILSLYQDKTGVIWIGTEGAGLNFFDPYSTLFHHIASNKSSNNYLNDKMVYAINHQKNGDWLIGTESGGLNLWHAESGIFSYFTKESQHLPHNTVRAIFPWQDDLWIATLGGLTLFDRDSKKVKHFNTSNLPELGHNAIITLHQSDQQQIWVGSYGGLDLFDTHAHKILRSYRETDPIDPLPKNFVTALLQDDEYLWVGTWGGGIVRYSISDGTASYYKHDTTDSTSLSNDRIFSIYRSDNDQIWIGTLGGGLNLYQAKSNSFEHFTKKQGLANAVVYGILQDSNSSIWLSTNRGLSQLKPEQKKINNFYRADGLQGIEFNAGAYFSDDDIMAFGGINGVTWLAKQQNKFNPFPPETKIVDFLLYNQSQDTLDNPLKISLNDEGEKVVELSHLQKMLSLEFRALHYSVPSRNRFKYRLLGVSEQWITSKPGQYSQTFTGLSTGQYVFEVYAISKDNISDPSPERIHLTVNPPPWATWWAYLGYFIIALVLFFYYRRSHLNKLATEQLHNRRLLEIDGLKESLSKSEQMAVVGELASNIAHSLRNPLSNIRTTAELIETSQESNQTTKNDSQLIVSEVDRLSLWIKELLSYSKQQQRDKNVNLVEIGRKLVEEFTRSTSLSKKNVVFKFEYDSKRAMIKAEPTLISHMFNSLIANAIDSIDERGIIEIKICHLNEMQIMVSIRDTGCGMTVDMQHRIFDQNTSTKPHGLGIGLSLVKRISERHGAKISVQSKIGQGSQFDLIFTATDEENN